MGPQRGWLTCALTTEHSGRRPAPPPPHPHHQSTFPCLRGPLTPEAARGRGDKWHGQG